MPLSFVGLGIWDETDISLKGLEELRKSEMVFAEQYTSEMKEGTLERLAELIGKGIVVLSREEVHARCDSPTFGGGILIPDAANVQPARLARGLRRVLLEKGVRIFEQTPVTRFGSARPAVAETPGGTVRAGEAVVGLGAWATSWRRFHPVTTIRGSAMVITAPAPEKLKEINWTGGESVHTMRSAVHYTRTTPDGRIAFGCGGLQRGLARKIDPSYDYDERLAREVAESLWRMFPNFRDVPIEGAWGGPINVSGLTMPFFGTAAPGNVHYGLGYTGNGVGPTYLGGKILASLATHAEDGFSRLGVVTRRPKRFPPEPLRSPGMLVVNHAIHRRDERLDKRRRPGYFTDFIAKYPRHPLAANAQYWIGEAYYVQHDFRQALLEFQKVVELGSGKVPDALVKVGLSYWGLRDPGRARAAWQRVAREHSGTESATLARSLLRKHTASRQ